MSSRPVEPVESQDVRARREGSTPREATIEDELARAAAEAAPDGIVLVDRDGRILFANAQTETMLGYPRSELVGQPIELLVPDRSRAAHPALRAAFVASPKVRPMGGAGRVLCARRRDGSELPVDVSLSPVRTQLGELVVAALRDATARLAAEQSLRTSEERLRSLFEQASEGIFIADLDGRYTDVNPAGCAMLGYARDELVGLTIVDLLVPEDVARLARAREHLLEPGSVEIADWTLRRKDGALLAVEVSAKILPDGRWQAFVRDVGERRRAEVALRESEAALSRAQRVAGLGSWDWDLATNRVQRSQQLYDLFGVTPRPGLDQARALADHIPVEERAEVLRVVDDALKAGHPYSVEHRIVRGDGAERVVRQQGEPIFEGGRPVRAVGTLLDITELRRAEREREASLRWFHTVFDQCPIPMILLHGVDGERVELNRHAEALVGRNIERVGGASGLVLDADERPLALDQLPGVRARRGERIDELELFFRKAEGDLVPVRISAAPLRDASGTIDGAVVAVQDITAARQLERLRTEWSSIVAHDLRQPLNVISLSCQLLRRAATDPPALHALERISSSTKRLSRMVDDLMDLSRLEAARLELSRDLVDLAALVRASVEECALDPASPAVELEARGATRVLADPERVAQIMANLLSNAIKYGRRGAPIRVSVIGGERDVSVAVTNEGAGISPDALPRLFRRFERSEHARQSAVKGIGLGLNITRGLVEAHGGRIEAESTPGVTTTFRFTLPLA